MITILCGRVAAGKTALARRLRQEKKALHLSVDDMMLGLYDGCLGEKHDETAMRCLLYLFSVAAQAEEGGIDSVLDYGFWLRAEREAARTYFTKRGLCHRLILVETPEQTRLSRLAHRNDTLRGESNRVYVIEGELLARLDAKFEPIESEENAELYDNASETT